MAENLYTIEWSPRSQHDLQCLDCHTRLDEETRARLAASIFHQAQILMRFPEIGRPLPLLGANWRQILRRPYRIIYFVDHASAEFLSVASGMPPGQSRARKI